MDKAQIMEFIARQKTAFLGTVDEHGYPVIRAMLSPRKITKNELYFSTNTSSKKVKQLTENDKACVYFYKRGKFKYQGVSLVGEAEICTDDRTKREIWHVGDRLFYKQGVTDPDYCVLKFTCKSAEYYCDFKIEKFEF